MAVIFHASVFYWMISPAAMLVLMQRIWRYYHPPPLSTRRDPLPLLSHLRRPRVTNGQDASPRHERSLKASSPASPSGKLENERETTWPSDCPNVPRGVIGFILTDIGFVRKEWPQPLFFRALKLPRSRLCLVPRSPGISGPVSISHPPPLLSLNRWSRSWRFGLALEVVSFDIGGFYVGRRDAASSWPCHCCH